MLAAALISQRWSSWSTLQASKPLWLGSNSLPFNMFSTISGYQPRQAAPPISLASKQRLNHFTNQFSDVFRNRRSTRLTTTDFPSPEEPEAAAVPANDGFGLHDHQGRPPIAPNPAQPSPEQSIGG